MADTSSAPSRQPSALKILTYPDPVLRGEAKEVTSFDESVAFLAHDMLHTLSLERGIGLAGPQVGETKRIIVLRVPDGEKMSVFAMVNPVVVESSGEQSMQEACLSLPLQKVTGHVRRASKVSVEYQDVTGVKQGMNATGLLSQAIQHEIDHLDGVLFVDKIGPVKKGMIEKHLKLLRGEDLRPARRMPRPRPKKKRRKS